MKSSNQILMRDSLSFAASGGQARLRIKSRENRTGFRVKLLILILDSPWLFEILSDFKLIDQINS